MIGGGGERYEASARAVAAHPYFRRSADTVIAFVIRGCWLGFGAWLSGLVLLRGAMDRRRERMLRDHVVGGTIVTTETKLAKLPPSEAGGPATPIATQKDTRRVRKKC